MVTDRLAAVRDLLVRQTGIAATKVTLEARLTEDFGIAGDDLVDLTENFLATFEPGGYVHAAHADAEGFSLLGRGSRPEPTRPIPVAMLIDALERGRWPD